MFNETSYLGAITNPDQIACGYSTVEEWKTAGRPRAPGCGTSVSVPNPGMPGGGVPTIQLPGSTPAGGGEITGAGSGTAAGSASSGGGFSLSSIPIWVWLIGAVFLLKR